CNVRVFDIVPADLPDAVEVFVGDIRDPDAVRAAVDGMDVVFHAAAVIELVGIASAAVRDRAVGINVRGTENVVAACQAASVPRLVHTSSANVCIDGEILEADESAPYAQTFVDLYAETKVGAENAVLAANSDTLRTVALRPGGLWGPGTGALMVTAFLEQLAAGNFVATIGDGTAVVDNTHVESLVRAELLAAQALSERSEVVAGQAYFITDEERINGIEWFRPIADGLGFAWPTRRVPGWLMYAVGWAGEVAHRFGGPKPTLTRIGVLKLVRGSSFRCDKARRDLGYEPLYTRDSGVAAHLDDYRASLARIQEGR
ncbi:MAG: NAD-dependent epimerase/dehydratase family protein, partial [Proteobacteria bacterium]|nr:NAD-dependent epimerase/dehydratase family protein [Pseudomonadota bacterium]